MLKLSIVEQATVPRDRTAFEAVEEAVTTTKHAEEHGFHRMWFAEHHGVGSVASHSPEVLMGMIARETRRIRIGSGAILLNHYSPLKVAELFYQLETVAPGRFDLGLGRATTGPIVDIALKRDRRAGHADDFDQQVQEVLAFLHRDFPADHPFSQITLMPTVTARPDPWLLGSSGSSAGLAAALGIGYSFAGFINPGGAVRALRAYRRAFTPTAYGQEAPQAMLGVSVFAADTDEEAHRMTWPTRAVYASLGHTDPGRIVVPSIDEASRVLTPAQKDEPSRIVDGRWPRQLAGSPATIRDQLGQMIEQSGATEVMLQSISPDQEARRYSHALVADALGIVNTADVATAGAA
ncbi:LLM class flavin-dependent oxidoreductase [Parafrankia sp. BMG5.11]|uniref:LLM class flavin-dependent oxidoreductase n=1 Tax=Parafrankia sp. BMG5.11 TaxID=222540 RepID=UPI00103D1310|nr:LLM class flavin-dependent oxidoreductase [Parafrankia sp. BMG5.11]TCJ30269.1 LLM class flavin-dependent oxidoreductase [Parafrankia sp. BMG5.11]